MELELIGCWSEKVFPLEYRQVVIFIHFLDSTKGSTIGHTETKFTEVSENLKYHILGIIGIIGRLIFKISSTDRCFYS